MAELFAGRWAASTAGNRSGAARSARMPGSTFLWLLSFGETKESNPLAAKASGTKVQHTQERAKNQSQARLSGLRQNDDDQSHRDEGNP